MRFRTGFVLGCAAGFYLTQKARRLRAPLAGRSPLTSPASDWLGRNGPGVHAAELRAEKILALGDLARERASDLLRGPVGNLARERVIARFESAIASQRAEATRGT
ncbi:MAG: hypothetical protein ACLQCU_02480 [Acidimicrobiales bacterium]|jgi:hypothetical protein